MALPQTCCAPLRQSLRLSELPLQTLDVTNLPRLRPAYSLARSQLLSSECKSWGSMPPHFKLGFSGGRICDAISALSSVSQGCAYTDGQKDRQARVATATISLAPGPCMPQAYAAQQVGTDRWQGLRAPMDARCYG
jgi:hypothetical protein